jgi:UDP-N-acetylmuramate: L-alanyl-gamma-D-glutamyl-meso-diaminopimelate ligase
MTPRGRTVVAGSSSRTAAGVDARHIPSTDDIVSTVSREARDGDLVVIMSNGGFDDIHRKLLSALERQP